jgi:hypothetical protein
VRLLALALAALAAGPAAAQVRRFEVVGAVALDPAAPPAAPRQAALRDALAEAVVLATREVLQPGGEPPPEGAAATAVPAVPGEPSEYAVSYRVLEDRGERDAEPAGGRAAREYVVLAEVQVDLARIREALGAAADPAAVAPGPDAGPSSFRLELLGIPSPAAWTAIRGALAQAGAASIVPLELEPGRALVEVESGLGAERTLERTLAAGLPGGLALEALPEAAGVKRLQVREGMPPPAPLEAPVD